MDNADNQNTLRKIEFDLTNQYKGIFKFNKETHILTVDFPAGSDAEKETQTIIGIIRKVDETVEVKEREIKPTFRKVLILENLDCAICASKIERIAKRTFSHEFIVVDFTSTRFIIETTDTVLIANLKERVQSIASSVDADINVIEKTRKPQKFANDFLKDRNRRAYFLIGCSIFLIGFIIKTLLKEMTTVNPVIITVIIYVTYTVGYLMLAGDVLYGAYKNIKSGRIFDEKFLMSLATITALAVGYYDEAVFVMIFYKLGELLQKQAINYSRKSIAELLDIMPQTANIIVNEELAEIDPIEAVVGDVIYVRNGERIPLDGVIVEGNSALDVSALTGESLTKDVFEGDAVLSGSINAGESLKIKVTKIYEDSMVSKILNLVENASSHKAKTENFISRFARYYTPIVVIIAFVLAIIIPFILPSYDLSWENGFKKSILTALIFLVVSCPCALVISIPLGFFGGIGGASRQGILIKGSNYLEALKDVDTFVFDKTGTLTKGKFAVSETLAFGDYSPDQILEYAAHCEFNTNHLIAKSIVEAYGAENIFLPRIVFQKQDSGFGVTNLVDGIKVMVGKSEYLQSQNVDVPVVEYPGTKVFVAIEGKAEGCIIIKDRIKGNAKAAISELKALGIKKIVMLTGDAQPIAAEVSQELGIEEYYCELTPINKVEKLAEIKAKMEDGRKIAFVGDGINDAPVLAGADIGIAMGGLGSDAAIQVADIVLMTDDISKLPTAIKIARKTHKIVLENIVMALTVKFAVLGLTLAEPFIGGAFFGFLLNFLIYEALFADVGVSLIAVLNSWRAMKVDK